ncbi:hypothetical protein ACQ5SO_07965 [Rhodovulum sp. DZ06]|uniref:hypothetical protein n=1 Tax=Rhodovulum sp. DZ06 TaxID=3425126 RepID=UPI003D33C206
MRTAAKFQLFESTGVEGEFERFKDCALNWVSKSYRDSGIGYEKKSYAAGDVSIDFEELDAGSSTAFDLDVRETLPAGQRLRVAANAVKLPDLLAVRIKIFLGAMEFGASHRDVHLTAPKFLRSFVSGKPDGLYASEGSGFREILPRFLSFDGSASQAFIDMLKSPDRTLPVVCISRNDEFPDNSGLASYLRSQFCGLAIFCEIDEAVSWAITDELGQQWSCFHGGIRIYWPGNVGVGRFRAHPLWPAFQIENALTRTTDTRKLWIAKELGRELLDASAFRHESPVFEQFVADAEAAARMAIAADDLSAIQKHSDKQIEKLKEKLAERDEELASLTAEVGTLRENNRALVQALSSHSASGGGVDLDELEEDEGEPQSFSEAVSRAQRLASDWLIFPDRLEDTVSKVWAEAGPPGKVLHHLMTLRDLAQEYAKSGGALGKGIVIWLRERNVEASGESETKKSNLYSFWCGGVSEKFELHTKPSDGVSPDRCVRIYFKPGESGGKFLLGFIGCKVDL